MSPKAVSLDLEISGMLEFYQAAASRSDSYMRGTLTDANRPVPSRESAISRPPSRLEADTSSRRHNSS
jgi:hypothetical protein